MTLGYKLSKLRKEKNYTQEQLADILGVSRQAISKWESDAAYPETEKMIRISDLFGCSLDYLFRDEIETEDKKRADGAASEAEAEAPAKPRGVYERKSKKTFMGMPLYHIGRNARGVVAIGMNARGIVAIGMRARGIISLGLLSMGVFSLGLVSLGFLSLAMLSLGAASFGSFSMGIFSAGAISLGIISVGAIAVGDFSVGALAIGKYFAYGDNARAMVAIGITEASGSVYQKLGELTPQEYGAVRQALDLSVPKQLSWAKEIIKLFLL
ncbi:MAG: helix-turn-helix domain-containing protein [Butyrivibrio sp.]|nr:helix-turn-helix domain-containing protein [Butyrivibrio sp.]